MSTTPTNNNNAASAANPSTPTAASISGTPKAHSQRGQAVFLRAAGEINAMSWDQRMKARVKSAIQRFPFSPSGAGTSMDTSNHFSTGIDSERKQQKKDDHHLQAGAGGGDDDSDIEQQGGQAATNQPTPQFRLEAIRQHHQPFSRTLLSYVTFGLVPRRSAAMMSGGGTAATATTTAAPTASGGGGIGINHNQQLASSLHWMFRVNFIFLFAVMCSIFFVWVMIFAGFIIGAGRMDPECVRIGGAPFGEASSEFADAFALSWTTFSTVGYGSTYPALGHENDNKTNCLLITVICSLESFLGVLYSGFCGAILFGKVLRIQSHAQVIFSDPIVIRYGPGVQQQQQQENQSQGQSNKQQQIPSHINTPSSKRRGLLRVDSSESDDIDDEDDHEDEEEEDDSSKKLPCPVLEFRVVNRLFGEVGGEIMDATLNVVANVDANDAGPDSSSSSAGTRSHSGRGGDDKSRRRSSRSSRSSHESYGDGTSSGRGRRPSSILGPGDTFLSDNLTELSGVTSTGSSPRFYSNRYASGGTFASYMNPALSRAVVGSNNGSSNADNEDASARLVNKRIFSKMMIEASDHPFFKRVWLGRHVLDDSSPILKPKVRRAIRRNQGYWPEHLNSHEAVRDALQFNQILVSLNGVSNVSASDVYAQKIYDFVDINVGYQFVNILYKDTDGTLKVDTDLINDVREQHGGGGEPLILGE